MATTNVISQTSAIPKRLYGGQLGNTANATVATVPSSSTWSIMSAVVCNTDSVSRTLTVDVVESGGSSAANRRVLSAYSILPGDTVSLADALVGMQLKDGDFIAAWASAATALTLTITGVEGS